jgi:hypothetical protein
MSRMRIIYYFFHILSPNPNRTQSGSSASRPPSLIDHVGMVWPFSSSDTKSTQPEEVKKISDDVQNSLKAPPPGMPEYSKETRRRKLTEAVNENCALDAAALLDCQDSWSLSNRMTLCHAFQSKYMDCLHSQRVYFSIRPTNLDSHC